MVDSNVNESAHTKRIKFDDSSSSEESDSSATREKLCQLCGEKRNEMFPIKKRTICRPCNNNRVNKCRGKDDDAKRLLFNLKSWSKKHGHPEGNLWSISDIQNLMDTWEPPMEMMEKKFRFKIKPIDPSKPFLPSNAKLMAFGV